MDKPTGWQNLITHAELSDVGLRRSNNQDSYGLVLATSEDNWHRRGHLFVVADGMGAHAAGELASKMAVDTITLVYFKQPDRSSADALRKSIVEANAKIHARGQANPDFRGMGTTSSVLAIVPEGALVGHVGDSRVYRLRGNRFEQLTADHSLVWEMMANSKLAEGELPGYIPKNIITRSLGPSEAVQVDIEGPFPLAEGDTFLLCSDGLSGQVPDEEMGAIVGALPPEEAVRVLVDLANLRGGPDNITVEIIRVGSLQGVATRSRGGDRGPGKSVHPALWVTLGVLLLAAVLFGATGKMIAAGAAGVAALILGFIVLVQKLSGGGDPGSQATSGQHGRGPHRSWVCPLDAGVIDRLNTLIEPVCQAARDQRWDIDWNRFQEIRGRGDAAAAANDFRTAVQEHCHAISFLMQEVRDQRRRASGAPIDIEGP